MGPTGTGFVRRAAVLGIASPVLFVLLVVVMGFIHPGYSHLTNFISDLGALDAPMPYVQRLNFFQFGIGITALAWALYMGMEQPSRVALVLQVIIGVGIFLSGIFPGHSSDPSSRETLLHNLVGIPAFLMIMLVPLVAGSRFRRSEAWQGLSPYSMAMTPVLVAMSFSWRGLMLRRQAIRACSSACSSVSGCSGWSWSPTGSTDSRASGVSL